jgi:hypothetical protein
MRKLVGNGPDSSSIRAMCTSVCVMSSQGLRSRIFQSTSDRLEQLTSVPSSKHEAQIKYTQCTKRPMDQTSTAVPHACPRTISGAPMTVGIAKGYALALSIGKSSITVDCITIDLSHPTHTHRQAHQAAGYGLDGSSPYNNDLDFLRHQVPYSPFHGFLYQWIR